MAGTEDSQVPGLDRTDLQLIDDLVDALQRSSEQEFVHGRYLDPVTLKYLNKDLESKTATFVGLPAFSTDHLKIHNTDKAFQGHPVRSLLQSRYRFRSTEGRDKTQVITHESDEDRIVVVPHIWALIINNYTVVTCAPMKPTEILGKTIKTGQYPNAPAGLSTGNLFFSDNRGNAFHFTDLHFTDPQGKVFCIPLASCRTWFGLVKSIVEECLDDEFDTIKERVKSELLNGGSSFQLVANEEFHVTIDSWLQLMKNRTGIIHMRLVDHQRRFQSLLVVHHQEEALKPSEASDVSSVMEDDRGDDATKPLTTSMLFGASGTPMLSTASPTAEGKSRNLANELRGLRAKLHEAKIQVDWERVLALSNDIPILENRILEWEAENLRSELRGKGDIFEEIEATSPATFGQRWRARPASVETSSLTSLDEKFSRLESSSDSGSSSRSTSPFRDRAQDSSPKHGRYNKRPRISRNHGRNISTAPNIGHSISFGPLRSRASARERSYAHGIPSHPRAPLQPLSCQQSRWDTVRLRIRGGQFISRASRQSRGNAVRSGVLSDQTKNRVGIRRLSNDSEDDRRKPDSDKRLVPPTPNDASKVQASTGYIQDLSQGPHDNIVGISRDGSSADPSTQLPTVVADWLKFPKTTRAPSALKIPAEDTALRIETNAESRKQQREGTLETRHNGTRPTLRRMIDFAHRAATMFPNLNASKEATGTSASGIAEGTEGVPIFLWPTKQKTSMLGSTQLELQRKNALEQGGIPISISPKPDDKAEEAVATSRTEEQALQTLLADMHNSLMKPYDPSKLSRDHASLYERTVGRSAVEAGSLLIPEGRLNRGPAVENMNWTTFMNKVNHESANSEGSGENLTAMGSSTLPASHHNLVTENLPEGHVSQLKPDVFGLAGTMLHAFVPEGYDAPIVSKYWGAVHKLLRQDILPVTHLPVTQIVASSLSRLHERVRNIQQGMRTVGGSQQTLDHLPESLKAAFQQLLMLFVVAGNMAELYLGNISEPYPNFVPRNQLEAIFEDCDKNLIQGRIDLIELIHRDDHDESVGSLAIDSEALLSLILANFAFHSSESEAFNLTKTYGKYTTQLRSMVRNRAYVRVHNHIPSLIEELDVIKTILKQQHRTLSNYREGVDIDTNFGISHLSLTVLNHLLENINQRTHNFEELLIEAQSAHAQSRLLKSESNNKAILVFTVTTIIFLPLSFVTSYLGMNTSDLRNMQSRQTLFWVIGTPVAVGVFCIALLAAFYGEITHRATRLYWRGKDKFD